jgi:hypothetical protein
LRLLLFFPHGSIFTNKHTGQSISNITAMPPVESQEMAAMNATTQVQEPQDRVHRKNKRQMKISARGKVKNQLYGVEGEVTGVILSEGTIVRFPQRMIDETNVNVNVGENIQASGFGTKNSNGQSIEATNLKN